MANDVTQLAYSVKDAALALGLPTDENGDPKRGSLATVYTLIRSGRIKANRLSDKPGSKLLISAESVRAFLDNEE